MEEMNELLKHKNDMIDKLSKYKVEEDNNKGSLNSLK